MTIIRDLVIDGEINTTDMHKEPFCIWNYSSDQNFPFFMFTPVPCQLLSFLY